ncbi:MAG: hypothetical protein OCD02_21165 [Spirochaetaceae bacterium]
MDSVYFNDLKENMNGQIVVFNKVLDINIQFQDSIVDRDWSTVSRCIDKLNELSITVNNLDSTRVDLLLVIVKALRSKENENLFSLIKKAPNEIKFELIDIFYKLKTSIIQVQGVFKGLNSFVEHKKEVSKEIIDVLVKDAKGNVYSKPGRRDNDGQGFLVNRQL